MLFPFIVVVWIFIFLFLSEKSLKSIYFENNIWTVLRFCLSFVRIWYPIAQTISESKCLVIPSSFFIFWGLPYHTPSSLLNSFIWNIYTFCRYGVLRVRASLMVSCWGLSPIHILYFSFSCSLVLSCIWNIFELSYISLSFAIVVCPWLFRSGARMQFHTFSRSLRVRRQERLDLFYCLRMLQQLLVLGLRIPYAKQNLNLFRSLLQHHSPTP